MRFVSGRGQPDRGYIAEVQRRAAEALGTFMQELKKACLQLDAVYWDDTVIFVSAKRVCLRFYGNEKLALYFAHAHKDKAGLEEDNILPLLPASVHVIHDHNIMDYNDDYSFTNIECNEHLLRDRQEVTDNLQRERSKDMKEHIQKTIHDRNEAVRAGRKEFDAEYMEGFFGKFNQLITQANREHMRNEAVYYYSEEAALILRMLEYKDNYFAWVCCFDLPVTNNLSERSLRGSKTHQKVSANF